MALDIHSPERNAGASHVGKVLIDGDAYSPAACERLIKDLQAALAFAKAAGTTRSNAGTSSLPKGLRLDRSPSNGWNGSYDITLECLAKNVIADAPVEVSAVVYGSNELRSVELVRGLLVKVEDFQLIFEDDVKIDIDLIAAFVIDD